MHNFSDIQYLMEAVIFKADEQLHFWQTGQLNGRAKYHFSYICGLNQWSDYNACFFCCHTFSPDSAGQTLPPIRLFFCQVLKENQGFVQFLEVLF